jgi:hypothetical protein
MKHNRVTSVLAVTAIAAALGLALFAGGAQAALKHFDGTVVAKNASAKTFSITTQGGARKTFKVNGSTVFERLGGAFGALRKGTAVEVDAVQTQSGLLARQVEPQGGNGGGGSDDGPGDDHGGGNDDGPNHT